ncbi:MAG: SAM-dependent methyltransferase [Vallitaleaceae bacterium]|nr:SAM-dependent methyltransferase [Vallitaleaceae bacterium]
MEGMEVLRQALNEGLVRMVCSEAREKTDYQKITVRRIEEKRTFYQIESFTKEQAFHKNIEEDAILAELENLAGRYKQIQMTTLIYQYVLRISKKMKLNVTKKKNQEEVKVTQGHNQKKKYLLEDGVAIDFLIHLGIMDESGKVRHKWYDKFRQINRYLELIEDSLSHMESKEPTIIDFGCGKSYLTFALYYYLVQVKKMKVKIIGLDLKESVIKNLNQLTKELGYENLEFRVGDIAMFDYEQDIDMVISLHACNLATDYAIEKAIKWQAKVIMAVPCCHKEINQQMKIDSMSVVLEYGIIKERMAALMTDALRAELIKACGYEVQVIEFVDMEHTPKNLMIRAYRDKKCERVGLDKSRLSDNYNEVLRSYHLQPTLERLLTESDL